MMKKLLSLILIFAMSSCFCVPAFAVDSSPNQGCTYIIHAETQEEYDSIVAEINAANAHAKQLWDQALIESMRPENRQFNQTQAFSNISPNATTTYTSRLVHHDEFIKYAGTCEMAFKVTAILGSDSYDHTIFTSIRDVTAYARNDNSSVEVDDTDSRIIDSGRTIAANYSTTIGVTTKTGQMSYFSRLFYVEFYAKTSSGIGGQVI